MSVSGILELSNVSKRFGPQLALDDVSLIVRAGEVHALAGHNGSGKSTVVKLLAGYHQPEPGYQARVDGQPFTLGDAAAAQAAGLRFVHQDLGLVDALDVVDNIALSTTYPTALGGRIRWGTARAQARELLAGLGYDIDPTALVGTLSPVERTGVAIARALHGWQEQVRLLVLDEPTAALTAPEVAQLFSTIERLRARDLGVIFVTHHLRELFEICDQVTVLRDGRVVATQPVAEVADEEELVTMMLGVRVRPTGATSGTTRVATKPTLSVRALGTATLRDIDLDVAAGEIVGVAGVAGSGRDELAGALFGAHARRGTVTVNDSTIPPQRPDRAIAAKMACLAAQRQRTGVIATMTMSQNLTVAQIPHRGHGALLGRRAERAEAAQWLERLSVTPFDPDRELHALSGGNQQKVLLGRWLRLRPRVLILDEPTEGVDAGTTRVVHQLIQQAARDGAAVLICSADTDELVTLADRIVVLRRGALAETVTRPAMDRDTVESLTLLTTGAQHD